VLDQSPLSQLLNALSDALGQAVGMDEHDECVIEFDEAVEVVLAQVPDTQVLSLRSALTTAGQPLERDLLQKALAFNYTDMPPGCAIALDQASQQLVMVALVDADRTCADDFLTLLSGMVELVPQLRESFETPRYPAESAMEGIGAWA